MTLSALRAVKCRGLSERECLQNESGHLPMISFCKQGGSVAGDPGRVPMIEGSGSAGRCILDALRTSWRLPARAGGGRMGSTLRDGCGLPGPAPGPAPGL